MTTSRNKFVRRIRGRAWFEVCQAVSLSAGTFSWKGCVDVGWGELSWFEGLVCVSRDWSVWSETAVYLSVCVLSSFRVAWGISVGGRMGFEVVAYTSVDGLVRLNVGCDVSIVELSSLAVIVRVVKLVRCGAVVYLCADELAVFSECPWVGSRVYVPWTNCIDTLTIKSKLSRELQLVRLHRMCGMKFRWMSPFRNSRVIKWRRIRRCGSLATNRADTEYSFQWLTVVQFDFSFVIKQLDAAFCEQSVSGLLSPWKQDSFCCFIEIDDDGSISHFWKRV